MTKLASAAICICLLISCNDSKESKHTLFSRLSSGHSNILFQNKIEETEQVNILTYEYTYNGGGVAAADFNNDGLCDLYFVGNTVSNKLYLNRGSLKFEDVTSASLTSGREMWKTGVAVVDINNDGWLDIYLSYSGPVSDSLRSNQLLVNRGSVNGGIPTFEDQAKQYGIDAPGTFTTQVAFFDYDKDGDLDLFMINHGNHFYGPFYNTKKLRHTRHPHFGNRLYRNNTTQHSNSIVPFTDVSEEAGIDGGGLNFSLGVSISDVNNDGWPDVYVSNDYEEQDFLYLNQKNGTFKDATKQSLFHLSRNGMGTDIADYNNDGKPDIITLDMWPEDNYRQKLLKGPDDYTRYKLMVDSGYHFQQMRNTLQLNVGNDEDGVPLFSEIGQLAGVSATDWSWAPLFADLDNDGWKDLFITNGYLRDFTSMDFLKYTVEEEKKRAQEKGQNLNLYQLVSKMTSTKVTDYVFRNNRDLTFSNATKEWGIEMQNLSFGLTYADLDNDGDLEIITNNTNEEASIWVNHATDETKNNFIRVALRGDSANRMAIGTKLRLYAHGQKQMQEVTLSRGYQSSVEPVIHFGIGNFGSADSILVDWPNGRTSSIKNVKANSKVMLRADSSANVATQIDKPEKFFFADITRQSGVKWRHKENAFEDFDFESLRPYRSSKLGPALAVGDVNGDGNDDFFVGGAAGQSAALWIAGKDLKFTETIHQPWQIDAASEDVGATFFDADNDHDLDLFVVSGGSEFTKGSKELQDRLYINDGRGQFSKSPTDAVVAEALNGSCVTAGDFDLDGDMDLYVGGGVYPRNFPMPSPGAILENLTDSKTKKIKFQVATSTICPSLREIGMVNDAVWTDFNNDKWPDLIVVGDWMSIKVFKNEKGKLQEWSASTLVNTDGLWKRILPVDLDLDGDVDYVIGNAGTNLPWRLTSEHPLRLYFADFDVDGKIDPIITQYLDGKEVPIASRDELLAKLPTLKKKFTTYDSYGKATLTDVIDPSKRAIAKSLHITTLETSVMMNEGIAGFKIKSLPLSAQFSTTFGLFSSDFNNDNWPDLLISGNFSDYRASYGPSDANTGLVVLNSGRANWVTDGVFMHSKCFEGDLRDWKKLTVNKQTLFVATRANGELILLRKE